MPISLVAFKTIDFGILFLKLFRVNSYSEWLSATT